jgi:outer membrane receptor for ferrienterochelin and colicin
MAMQSGQDRHWTWRWMSLGMAVALAAQAPAHEQAKDPAAYFQMSLEELVETPYDVVEGASKYKQEAGRAPATVTVITAEEIRLYGYRNLPEILNSVTGLFTTYDRNYYYLGVRGLRRPGDYDSRVLLLVNGFRVNENIADAAGIGWELPIDVDLIERVEVIRGPGSSLYGSNALLAVVNITTKSGRSLKGLEALAEISDYQGARGRLSWGQDLGQDRSLLVSASGYRTHGPSLYFP